MQSPTARLSSLIRAIDADDELNDTSRPGCRPSECGARGRPRKLRRLPRFAEAENAVELPELVMPTTSVVYTWSESEADELCHNLLQSVECSSLTLVGLDIEWKCTFVTQQVQRPTALVQIAAKGVVYVFHISRMARFPEYLARLIEDARLHKAGCKVVNDVGKLQRDFGLKGSSLIELSDLAAASLPCGQRPWSLADLCASTIRRKLPKDENVRRSNWETMRLDSTQLRYAAIDAWASLMIAEELLRRIRPEMSSAGWSALLANFSQHIGDDAMWSRRSEGRAWLQRRSH